MENIQDKYKQFSDSIQDFAYHKDDLIKIIFINILINGSILIEDLPWIWKTMLSRAIANLLWFKFNRIQWTSDLVPQDIIWWEYYNFNTKEIEIRKWPIFTELLLIDEINRMNPKTQSAFLQAMEEKTVSIMWNEFELSKSFFVIATQNPIEYSWTFPLPEAQKDRFTSRISIWMPDNKLQLEILKNNSYITLESKLNKLNWIISEEELDIYYKEIIKIKINDDVWIRFIRFFNEIKKSNKIIYPLSQRWIYVFSMWCRANAYLAWRSYVIPKDWEELIESFLIHRLDIDSSETELIKELYDYSFKNF